MEACSAMMTRHQMRLKVLRAGYNIPLAMEWMFWPMGYRPPVPITGVAGEVVTITRIAGPTIEPLERRYKITNIGEYSKQLLRLGAIREVK
jgi:hypothetical protein